MLREDTIYLKFSTYHGLMHDATFLEVLELLHTWARRPFAWLQEVEHRGRPRPLTPDLMMSALHRRVGQGIHQAARLKLWNEPGCPVRSCEILAGGHPYSGAFHTQLEIRLERAWAQQQPQRAAQVIKRRFIDLARLLHPFQGHAHDTDDNSIQNIDKPGLLRRGFGLEDVPDTIDLAANPGRELSRREYRYVVNWLTLVGPGLLDHLGPQVVQSAPATSVERLDIDPDARQLPAEEVARRMGEAPAPLRKEWWLLQVGETPLEAAQPQVRQVQADVRQHLGLAALADKERWEMGYWQRKA